MAKKPALIDLTPEQEVKLYSELLTEYERLGNHLASPRWRKLSPLQITSMMNIFQSFNKYLKQPKKKKEKSR